MNKKETETLFFVLYIIYIVNQVLSESQFINIEVISIVLSVTRYLIFFLLLFLITHKKTYQNSIKILILLVALGFVILNLIVADGGISLLMIILFVLASQGYSLKKIFKISIITLIVMHVFVIGCACVGILEDTVEYRYIGNLSGSFFVEIYNQFSGAYNRHNMGFLVHNQIALSFFCVYLMYIVYRNKNIRWYESVVIMILNIIVFNYFGSRLIFIINVAVCMAYYIVKIVDRIIKKTCFFWISYPICTIISFAVALQYSSSNPLSLKLDLIFNNRLRLAKDAIDFYGLGVIGSGQYAGTYNSSTLLENTVDNGYVAIFIQTGIVVALIIIAIWTYVTYISEKNNNRYLLLALVVLAVENILNAHLGAYKLLPFLCVMMNVEDPFVKGEQRGRKTGRIKFSWR